MALPERIRQIRQFLKGEPQKPQRTGLSFSRRPVLKKPAPGKREYARSEFKGLLQGAWRGSRLSQQERIGLEKSLFPYQRYGEKISEGDVKGVLQKLRKDEYWAKDFKEKERISRQRKALEEATGFKGRY